MTRDKSDIEVKHEKPATPASSGAGRGSMTTLRDEIDRLFEEFGGGHWRQPLSRRMQGLWGSDLVVSPATELVECDGEYRITAELPGMSPEDVEIKLTDGLITLRGEKSEEKKEEKEDYLLNERRYGAFQRSLPLPPGIDAEAVSASFANGILTVTLPKSAEAKQKERKIEVKVA